MSATLAMISLLLAKNGLKKFRITSIDWRTTTRNSARWWKAYGVRFKLILENFKIRMSKLCFQTMKNETIEHLVKDVATTWGADPAEALFYAENFDPKKESNPGEESLKRHMDYEMYKGKLKIRLRRSRTGANLKMHTRILFAKRSCHLIRTNLEELNDGSNDVTDTVSSTLEFCGYLTIKDGCQRI